MLFLAAAKPKVMIVIFCFTAEVNFTGWSINLFTVAYSVIGYKIGGKYVTVDGFMTDLEAVEVLVTHPPREFLHSLLTGTEIAAQLPYSVTVYN